MAVRRAVVTGVGVVTPMDGGRGTEVFWRGLCEGRNAVGPVRSFDTARCACNVAGEVRDFDASSLPAPFQSAGRCEQMFARACLSALEDAGGETLPDGAGIVFGTILGGMNSGLEYMDRSFFGNGEKEASLLRGYPAHSVPSGLARFLGLEGPNLCVSTACSAGADAVGLAVEEIRSGRAGVMIAGGADVFNEFIFRGFLALNALTSDGHVRPFDRDRTGLAVSEGAAVLVLEDAERAGKRGARAYCTVAGYGCTSDGSHLVRPRQDGGGLARAVTDALEQAGAEPLDIGYVSAHGTGTFYNDAAETAALKLALGEHAKRIGVSSIKSMIGHSMGASAAVEAVSCLKVMETGIIPPTINYRTPDPGCDLDWVPNEAREQKVDTALSVSAGFGGQNSALVFRKEPS
ncbi:MAG: beta-ketoacyl-[acyl-carrier-protein] synthase family protein [Kiritimatiellia bacterium]